MSFSLGDISLLKAKAFIGGNWVEARSGETFEVFNPASGEVVACLPLCGAAEAAEAIAAAEAAQPAWGALSAKTRSEKLLKWHDLVMAHQDDLARILTAEQGKPLTEARAEIAYGAAFIKWFSEEARRVYGDTIPGPAPDKRIVCIKQPVGVVACITPWNFPNAMLTRKIAPALAAGCTVVCKPANQTPLSACALVELAVRAGIPGEAINLVNGKTREIGQVLTSSPVVRKLSFTGSTEVGKLLSKACADTVKRTSMELGGNAPFIVFDDADLDEAVRGAMASKFRNAGQTCASANRILVQDGIFDVFAEKFVAAVASLKVGPGNEDGVTVGPLINSGAAEDVRALIDDALAGGAARLVGGDASRFGPSFINPTILTDVKPSMRIFNEEIFGPVAPLVRFSTEKEAIELANATPYGLASYFYARDIGRIWRVSEALEYGMVGINEGIISNEAAPFGGIKESGQGREGSKYGLDDYLEIKYLCMGGIQP